MYERPEKVKALFGFRQAQATGNAGRAYGFARVQGENETNSWNY
jgi:hypothetical protein